MTEQDEREREIRGRIKGGYPITAEDAKFVLDAERKRVQELQKERDKAKRSREHTWDWIARHYGKLEDWAREILPEPWQTQFFSCVANGSYHVTDDVDAKGQTNYFHMESAQEQLLYDHMKRAEDSEERVQELEGALRASIEQMKRDRHNLRESAQKLQLHDRLLLNAIVIDLDQDIAEAESLLSKEQK